MNRKLLIFIILSLTLLFAACGDKTTEGAKGNNVISGQSEDFRSIQAEKLNGSVNVARENAASFGVYEGMSFNSGDKVNVAGSSSLLIAADSDKHLYAEEETAFSIEASGKKGSTQTHIRLEDGSVLCRLDEKLSSAEAFEIETESATMAVRGTIFRVSKITGSDGSKYEMVQVFDGKVYVEIKESGDNITLSEGECCLIKIYSEGNDRFVLEGEIDSIFWKNGETEDFIVSENGSGSSILTIPYEKIPRDVLELLITAAEDGRITVISDKTLTDVLETGHSFEEQIIKEASCTEDGLATLHCVLCGEDSEELISAFGHDVITDEATEASCSAPGLTEGSHCGRCGEVFTAQEETEQLQHTVVTEEGIPASCLEDGMSESITCSVCGEVIKEHTVIPRLSHVSVNDEAVEAGCTETGLGKGSHCALCGRTLVKQEVIPATGHSIMTDAAIAPTCTEDGLGEGSHCSVCGAILTEQKNIPAIGHSESADAEIMPLCTTPGKTGGSHCSVCGAVLSEGTEIPATGHKTVYDYGYSPTCVLGGATTG
ncbi:MAG: FecR family protein, partial [Oscillospiraceae bacterium]|nr:FecR family protein [Oscillospiraceae bacterium]